VNPYVLTYRGNVLARLGRYGDAVEDYSVASDRFNSMRDVARYSDARANLALALYETGKTDDAIKVMVITIYT
jgi:tetratricopeptide (TPR) repeat protein